MPGHNFTASAVAADGRIYWGTAEGKVVVVKAGRTFEKPIINEIGEPILATPAISGNMLIIRTQNHLVAVAESAVGSR
jgi:hypothetical protein